MSSWERKGKIKKNEMSVNRTFNEKEGNTGIFSKLFLDDEENESIQVGNSSD